MDYYTFDQLFIKYLESKGVIVNNKLDEKYFADNISEEKIKEQLRIINEFHKCTMGYSGYMNKSLKNETGRLFEENKVQLKKTKRYINKLQKENLENKFDKLIFHNSHYFLIAAEKSIETINKIDYIGLILRSMRRVEVCSGCASFSTIKKDKQLQLKSIEQCCYDMVEVDIAKFFIRLKRKGVSANWHHMARFYCELAGLGEDSATFIIASISFPYETFKCIKRYRTNSKNWDLDYYCKKLNNCIVADGVMLI